MYHAVFQSKYIGRVCIKIVVVRLVSLKSKCKSVISIARLECLSILILFWYKPNLT